MLDLAENFLKTFCSTSSANCHSFESTWTSFSWFFSPLTKNLVKYSCWHLYLSLCFGNVKLLWTGNGPLWTNSLNAWSVREDGLSAGSNGAASLGYSEVEGTEAVVEADEVVTSVDGPTFAGPKYVKSVSEERRGVLQLLQIMIHRKKMKNPIDTCCLLCM